ncbi:MAG: hypothetical protein A3A43_01875 [Candidatus Liptonbacteria bacterium RIFCSPLOWO2_01_FULL_56_20]|uniref:Uncharacterized protein n=1 Tax=Candidatus Liptonbacteria bacterium RIFCSPLOWO2_01_FULL_56_20 TaxID=1798652 RepID=A0A1G2CHM6_9BACT|nr:MAG: hypothetical protein A2681_01950 [Candidatus Liptonbacteria bacterium RIFCSPHIGHO2_01_FULL_56_18b]OGZ00914.1 MAG: hypothetical protein A3A43_01875 [Candidatus Liptonbacteria bacterium RIFCSPLOWO2_01_FULL_56_20]
MYVASKLKTLHWTYHSREKMRFYKLSEARVRRIMHSPSRVEEGIAPKTVAYMQRAGSVKHPYELWTMAQDVGSRRKVISAWRYPGVTKPRSEVTLNLLTHEYANYLKESGEKKSRLQKTLKRSRWFKTQ